MTFEVGEEIILEDENGQLMKGVVVSKKSDHATVTYTVQQWEGLGWTSKSYS